VFYRLHLELFEDRIVLSTIHWIDLHLASNATLPVASLSTFHRGNILAAAGGVLALPLTTIDKAGSTFSPTFQADGTGSRLDLSHVTTWQGAGDAGFGSRIVVASTAGGTVDVSQLAQIAAGNTDFQVADGGQINANVNPLSPKERSTPEETGLLTTPLKNRTARQLEHTREEGRPFSGSTETPPDIC
jgi:hypothetical protein